MKTNKLLTLLSILILQLFAFWLKAGTDASISALISPEETVEVGQETLILEIRNNGPDLLTSVQVIIELEDDLVLSPTFSGLEYLYLEFSEPRR